MPKIALSDRSKINAIVSQYPEEFVRSPNDDLYCNLCSTVVSHAKSYFVESHRKTAKHQRAIGVSANATVQQFLNPKGDFTRDVLKAFLSADIPLWKLRNPELRKLFLGIGHPLPCEQSCRLRINDVFEEEMQRICDYVKNQPVFFVVDESEVAGCKYVNLLVGILSVPQTAYLFECLPLASAANGDAILRIIDDCIDYLCISRDHFQLLLTDAASYMISAGNTLHRLYPNLFHVTCLAHLIHNCAMKVKCHYSQVDQLISRIKNATIKNKTRSRDFAAIGCPPDTIVTRWGSWLNTALYYGKNLPAVRRIVRSWNGTGILLSQAQEIVEDATLMNNLMEIETCYSGLIDVIQRLEGAACGISEGYALVRNLDFQEDPCNLSVYLDDRLKRNEVEDILNCTREEISPHAYVLLSNCQCTSASVERSFSLLKKILTKERNFNRENVRRYIVVYYNSSIGRENSD
jgi:hypothetical protein